jgi:hypothetical protein
MKIVGCDFRTRYKQIAMLDDETGELVAPPVGPREWRDLGCRHATVSATNKDP